MLTEMGRQTDDGDDYNDNNWWAEAGNDIFSEYIMCIIIVS